MFWGMLEDPLQPSSCTRLVASISRTAPMQLEGGGDHWARQPSVAHLFGGFVDETLGLGGHVVNDWVQLLHAVGQRRVHLGRKVAGDRLQLFGYVLSQRIDLVLDRLAHGWFQLGRRLVYQRLGLGRNLTDGRLLFRRCRHGGGICGRSRRSLFGPKRCKSQRAHAHTHAQTLTNECAQAHYA